MTAYERFRWEPTCASFHTPTITAEELAVVFLKIGIAENGLHSNIYATTINDCLSIANSMDQNDCVFGNKMSTFTIQKTDGAAKVNKN